MLEPDHRHDVPRERGLLVLPVVGVHLEDPADPFLAVLRGVLDVGPGPDHPRVDADVGEATHVRVAHDLEGEGREGLLVAGLPDHFLARLGVGATHRGHVER